MKKYLLGIYSICFFILVFITCSKYDISEDIINNDSINEESSISTELWKLISAEDTIPIELLQEYSTSNIIEVKNGEFVFIKEVMPKKIPAP